MAFRVSAARTATLAQVERIVILIADTPLVNPELFQGWRRRKGFLAPLLAAGPGRVSESVGSRFHIHSKTSIFDDEFAIVGSANCIRRGYSHDNEQAIGVFDAGESGRWVRDPRTSLWTKHLRVPAPAVADLLASAALWATPPAGAQVAAYRIDGGADPPDVPVRFDWFWNLVVDPRGR